MTAVPAAFVRFGSASMVPIDAVWMRGAAIEDVFDWQAEVWSAAGTAGTELWEASCRALDGADPGVQVFWQGEYHPYVAQVCEVVMDERGCHAFLLGQSRVLDG